MESFMLRPSAFTYRLTRKEEEKLRPLYNMNKYIEKKYENGINITS